MSTKIVILGTGTPNPTPERSGPGVAIIVEDNAYLVDCGVGIVRQTRKAYELGIDALDTKNLKTAFITHLHSDHTLGLPDLIFTPWILEREERLNLYGPKGLDEMVSHIEQAYKIDIDTRINGLEQGNKIGYKTNVTHIEEGLIYEDELVQVEAFKVNHPPMEAYGYKFTTQDKTIVISGDTTPWNNLIDYAKDCDILIHEVFSSQGIKDRNEKWLMYHSSVHTSSIDLSKVAKEANPKKLVLYHQLFMRNKDKDGKLISEKDREKEMISEIKRYYKGEIISAKDMDIID